MRRLSRTRPPALASRRLFCACRFGLAPRSTCCVGGVYPPRRSLSSGRSKCRGYPKSAAGTGPHTTPKGVPRKMGKPAVCFPKGRLVRRPFDDSIVTDTGCRRGPVSRWRPFRARTIPPATARRAGPMGIMQQVLWSHTEFVAAGRWVQSERKSTREADYVFSGATGTRPGYTAGCTRNDFSSRSYPYQGEVVVHLRGTIAQE